ncbi:MAG: PadR family transcriptional regulator [Candidatus Bathyarchaeota archaeon]|nr:PadR family transcriptional regulator [Candidatus Bathyarchaeota archaeon]
MRLEIEPNMQERSLKAFLDLAILSALAEQPLTGYKISRLFLKKFGILISPSMIYANLKNLEKKGWIKCNQKQDGRTYSLTEQGRNIVENMTNITQEIRSSIITMLRN